VFGDVFGQFRDVFGDVFGQFRDVFGQFRYVSR
jgi:hypothetical protein